MVTLWRNAFLLWLGQIQAHHKQQGVIGLNPGETEAGASIKPANNVSTSAIVFLSLCLIKHTSESIANVLGNISFSDQSDRG